MEDVLRFAALFQGRTDAIGFNEGRVERRPITAYDYEGHLNGEQGIGIFPLRDDATVRFAAIDLDEPDFDTARLFQRMIPGTSFIERSRSGNAHVWAFFDGDCPAWAARGWLRHVTAACGREEVEVFPKQDAVREGGVGNYINLPWFGQDERPTLRWDWDAQDLVPMDFDHFLQKAEDTRQDPDAWVRRCERVGIVKPEDREDTSEFGQSPFLHECATYILEGSATGERPITSGGRHQVLFHVACMLLNYRDLTEDEAWQMVKDLNDEAEPPLPDHEVGRLFNNALNGEFTFTGCDDPVMRPYVRDDCPIAKGEVGR